MTKHPKRPYVDVSEFHNRERPRMEVAMDFAQVAPGEMGVYLRG